MQFALALLHSDRTRLCCSHLPCGTETEVVLLKIQSSAWTVPPQALVADFRLQYLLTARTVCMRNGEDFHKVAH